MLRRLETSSFDAGASRTFGRGWQCVRQGGRPGARSAALADADDRTLAALVAEDDDEAAFEAMFERYAPRVLTLCRHMLGSREEAEDALQHTFAAAYRQLVDREPLEHPRAWLYATARNRCLTVLRARRELPARELDAPSAWLPEEVERRSDLRDLLADIARLPEDQRVALVLAELDDLDHAEIATVIGCRRDKVRALVYQARSSLAGWREARDLSCREVRAELATARGGELRRGHLQRHLALCDECAAFRREVDRQRRKVALLVPPLPLALGMKEAAAAAAGVGGAGARAPPRAQAPRAEPRAAAAGSLGATALKAGTTALVIGAAGVAGFSGLGGGSPEPESPNGSRPAARVRARARSAAERPGKAERRRRAAARANVRQNAPGSRRSEQVQDPAAAAGAAGATSSVPAQPPVSVPQPPPLPQTEVPVEPPQAPAAPALPEAGVKGDVELPAPEAILPAP